jgi:xylan 1,4-beta-xylosidase
MKILLLAFFLLGMGLSAQKTINKASFERFCYSGNDAFYKQQKPTESQFTNPILQGYYPDPSVCRKGNDFYMVNSSFSHYPGVPIFHSTDLVHWTQLGHVLDRPSQLNLDTLPVSYGIFAPAIEYNPYNDTFYMITTLVGKGGNFLVKAKDPKGPWSDPIWLPKVTGIDPSLMFDDDGRAYIVNNSEPDYPAIYSGHRAVWIHEFDVATDKTVGTSKVLIDGGIDISTEPQWIEGPHLYKINGKYYLMAAEGGTSINHSEVILRADSPWGPYEIWDKNPILTQRHLAPNRPFPVTNAGHADIIQDIDGNWWSVFLACRPYENNLFNIGRETFLLPVTWEDGWPIITKQNEAIPLIVDKANLAKTNANQYMPTGNFSYCDEFEQATLGLQWIMVRTPRTNWHNIEKGKLNIDCEPTSIGERKNPAFVARRQQHHWFETSTHLTFSPKSANESAGLVCFQNDAHYYYLGMHKKGKQRVVRLTKGLSNNKSEILAEFPVKTSNLELKIVGEGANMSFYYATKPGQWQSVAANVDARYLSTDYAGGFVGTIIGLYATSADNSTPND